MNPSFDTSQELSEKVLALPRRIETTEEEEPVTSAPLPPQPPLPPLPSQPSQSSSPSIGPALSTSRPSRSKPRPPPRTNVSSESVDVYLAPIPPAVREQLEPQPKEGTKYNHFQFKDRVRMERALTQRIQTSVSEPVQVEFHYNVKKRPDVHITRTSDHSTVGKVHFLHFNRPDMCDPSKWFVKLFFYDFTDADAFESIRQAMVEFFKKLGASRSPWPSAQNVRRGVGGSRRRHRRRHSSRKKRATRRHHRR